MAGRPVQRVVVNGIVERQQAHPTTGLGEDEAVQSERAIIIFMTWFVPP